MTLALVLQSIHMATMADDDPETRGVTTPPKTDPGMTVPELAVVAGYPLPPAPAVRRNARGQVLPGQKLNPTGSRNNLPAIIRRVVEQHGGFEKAAEVLCEIAWGRLANGARLADRMRAIEILYDRVFGRAVERVNIDDGNRGTAALAGRPLSELVEMRRALRALREGNDDVQEAEIVE